MVEGFTSRRGIGSKQTMVKKKELWIPKLKKDVLSKQLSITEKEDIPIGLLKAIKETDVGEMMENPMKTGKRHYKVTKLMKKRASLALTLKGFKKS